MSEVAGECSVTLSTYPTATDNCKGTITATTNDPLTYDIPGVYTVNWIYNDGEGNESVQTQTVIVESLDTSVTTDGVTLTSNLSTSFYQWIDCETGEAVSGETAQSFIPSADGSYAVEVSQNDCVAKSPCYTVIKLGLLDNDFGTLLSVFPNPTSDFLNIDLGGFYSEIIVVIKDASGREVLSKDYREEIGVELNLENLSRGSYFVYLTADKKQSVLKVVKE